MKLSDVIRDLPLASPPRGSAEVPAVTGVSHDSRRVQPGDLFVALRGERFDGRRFAPEAVGRGAVAVLAEGQPTAELPVPWLTTAGDPRPLLGPLAARVYGHPDRQLVLVGVTGTNGKSTVVALVAAVLTAAGLPAGRLGTLGYVFRELQLPGERTTPEASDVFRILRHMADAGARAAAMEVSSHALMLGRVAGAAFDVAVFTNLTRDHLDFHRDFESYFAAKRQLFGMLKPGGRAVIHADDPWGQRLLGELEGALSWGREAAVRPLDVVLDTAGIRGRIATPRGEYGFESPLVGRFNLENLLAAAAVAEALELPVEAVRSAFAGSGPIPGRMEAVALPGAAREVACFVDFAHTPAALEAALRSARELATGPLVLVFGCGGDRDPSKREPMGRLAGELADLPIATSDNPRSEDPLRILRAVENGLKVSGNRHYRVMPDRREAIRRAVAVAPPGAVVVVAGKGHEERQLIDGQSLPFSDREELLQALEERFGGKKSR